MHVFNRGRRVPITPDDAAKLAQLATDLATYNPHLTVDQAQTLLQSALEAHPPIAPPPERRRFPFRNCRKP